MKIDITDPQLDTLFEALKTKAHILKTLGNRAEYIKYSRLINYLTLTKDADTGK